jgi:hypothetical protein
MKTVKRSITMLLYMLFGMLVAQAQTAPDTRQEAQANNPIAQDVTIIIQQEQVRFTSQKTVAEMQLQVFDQAGHLVYDSGAVSESELKWVLRQSNGEAVKSGLYAYTLTVKEAGAETARVRRGHFIVDRAKERDGQTDRLWITSQNDSGVGTELTAAINEGVTIAGMSAPSEPKSAKAAEDTARQGERQSKNKNPEMATQAANGTLGQIAKFISATDLGDSGIIEQNGNVGIGTTSPISKFHIVSGTGDHLPPRLQSSSTDTFAAGWDFYHGSTGVGYVGVPDGNAAIAPGEMLVYGVGDTSLWAWGQRSLTINWEGNVGIGTPTPDTTTRLYVVGPGSLSAVYGKATGYGTGLIGTSVSGTGVYGSAGPSGDAAFFDGRVKVGGNLLPRWQNYYDLGSTEYRWRTLYAVNGTIQTSDARLKKGVTNLRYGLRELMQLRPVSFEWKDNSDGQQHLGFIAQETEKIIPEAVTRAANPDTPLGMNYSTLIPVVIKAIQEQQNTLTTLKNDNEALQQRNTTLQRQNADLETRLLALEQTMQQLMAAAGSGTRDQAPAVSSVSQGVASLQKQQREQAQR